MAYTEHHYFADQEYIRIGDLVADLYGRDIDEEGWKLDFNNRKRSLGVCNYTKKTIYLSNHLIATGDKAEITDTIAHEIAHTLCPGDDHGPTWRRVAISLGSNGNRCAEGFDMQIKHSWEVVHCETGEVFGHYHKKPRRDPKTLFIKGRKAETFGKLVYKKVS
jgi:predicted metal-dependent hydrolase